MSRMGRYKAAVVLAQEILAEDPADDAVFVQQAVDDLVDELRAGRRNQQEMADVNRRTVELLGRWGYSVKKVPERPLLRVLTSDDFDELVKEGT